MQLLDLRNRVRELSLVGATPLMADSLINQYINEAYQKTCRLFESTLLREQVTGTLSAGVTDYPALLTGVRHVRGITVTDGLDTWPLEERSELALYEKYEGTTQGRPDFYAETYPTPGVRQITVYPTPDKEYTVKMLALVSVTPLVLDTDVPIFAAEYHPLLAYEAAARALARYGEDAGQVQEYRKQALDMIVDMRNDLRTDFDETPVVLAGRRRGLATKRRTPSWRF